jgi:uncharacterized membrane protein
MLWLLMMVVTPFATKTLTGPGDNGSSNPIRFTLYAVVQVLAGLLFVLMARTMYVHKLLRPNAPANLRRSVNWQGTTIMIMFGVSIPLFWITSYAWVFWIVGPPVMRITSKLVRRHWKDTEPLS